MVFFSKKANVIPFIFFTFISIYVVTSAFRGPYLLRFVDERFPVNPIGDLIRVFGSWDPENMGYNYTLNIFLIPSTFLPEAILSYLRIPLFLNQDILLFLYNLTALYFFYLFLNRYIFVHLNNPNLRIFLSSVGSLLLVFNFSTLILYWFDTSPYGEFTIAMTALEVYFVTVSLENFNDNILNYKYWIITLAISGLFLSANIPVNVSPLLISLSFPAMAMVSINKFKIKKVLKFYLIYIGIILTSNFWWYINSFIVAKNLAPTSTLSNLYIFFFDSKNLTFENVTRGLYLYFYNHVNLSPTAGWSNITKYIYISVGMTLYIIPLIILLTLIIVFISFVYKIIYKKRVFDNVYLFLMVFISLIISILLVMGSNSPMLPIFRDMFKIPVLSLILRDPAWTFGEFFYAYLILSFLLSITYFYNFFIYLQRKFLNKKTKYQRIFRNKKLRLLFVFVIILLVILPVLLENSAFYTGNAIPSSPYKDTFTPPSYEINTINFLKNRTIYQYALLVPGGFQILNVSHGYDSFDYIASSLPNNMIISDGGNNVTSTIYDIIDSGTSYEYKNFYKTMLNFDIKYIVIEGNMGSSPFNVTIPNYKNILKSLNNTNNISLDKKIGPNYIYKVDGRANLVSVSDNYLSETDFAPMNTFPYYNITEMYYNLSKFNDAEFNHYSIFQNSTYTNNEIKISLNNTFRSYFYNETGRLNYATAIGTRLVIPTYMNIIPLNINTKYLPYLLLKFKTNVNTAISIDLITTKNITSGFYSDYVENSNYQAGYSYSNIYSSLYVINHYTSPDHYTCFVDNMRSELNYFNANKTVYYIAIRFYPLENNGTEFKNEYNNPSVPPIMQWPEYNNLTISDISLGQSYYASVNLNKSYHLVNEIPNYNITEMYYNFKLKQDPDNYVNNSLYIINTNVNNNNVSEHILNIEYRKISNEKFKVTLEVKTRNLTTPLLIIFKQNYEQSWILLNGLGISRDGRSMVSFMFSDS